MVLGLRSKSRKAAAFQVDYTVHVQELRPWPPSQSLRTLRSVVLQWENGERNSGSGSPVVPSLADGKIVFNESFKLQVTLLKEAPVKGNDSGTFQKNVLELNLYEPRREKTVKGQHLGSAAVDLAEHGIINEAVNLSIPVNCKRSFRNTALPVLFLKIQPFEKAYHSSSSRESLSKEVSLDKDGRESISALMNEEYAEEAEIASFTDDDISSSHSSLTHTASAFESNADSPEEQQHNEDDSTLNFKQDAALGNVWYRNDYSVVHQTESSCGSRSIELYHVPENSENGGRSIAKSPQRNLMPITRKPNAAGIYNSLPSKTSEHIEQEVNCRESESSTNYCQVQGVPLGATDDLAEPSRTVSHFRSKYSISSTLNKVGYSIYSSSEEVKSNIVTIARTDLNPDDDVSLKINKNLIENDLSGNSAHEELLERTRDKSLPEYAAEKVNQNNSVEIKCSNDNSNGLPPSVQASNLERSTVNQQFAISQKASEKEVNANTPVYGTFSQTKVGSFTSEKLKNMMSVQLPLSMVESDLSNTNDHFTEEVKETEILEDAHHGSRTFNMVAGTDNQGGTGRSSDKHIPRNIENSYSDDKIEELEHRVAMLEAELREAAAIEISLYSFLAEHGSSGQKVHAPARRLSRLYSHASKLSHERRASAARSAVSGLVLVAKACGNDVPRLTFWLSNLVVLRAIVSQGTDSSDLQISAGCHPESDGTTGSGIQKSSSPLRWSPASKRENKHLFVAENHDWENPTIFISALERVEAWIFSRIIESVWWQTLTPYMQSTNENGKPKTSVNMKKGYGRKPTAANQQQANFSTDLWKKAFKDACERLCPVRAGGHECGCLPLLPRLIMEQCVARLDVAMFNAILRESIDEIPTDPVSDPISDSKVLPIPASKSSFGAGAQLKNAIGNWSRWLTDLFGIDGDDDSPEHENEQDGDRHETSTSFKPFHLLNAFSDLLMLPKDMLLDESIRKEVCPTFNASIIKRILNSFEPDEFCPDPIPDAVFRALDSEDALENGEEVIRNFPCNASPIVYSPPSVASVMPEIGDVLNQHPLRRSSSSVLRKCHTSDDELEELDSPLALIIMDKSVVETPKFKGGADVIRYQLLREVWRDDD
ncbi:hypothetical protein Taro_053791 [Colocasia esculenta]|uniref:C2 NT-type domain-containing protein n=1 Tax=Colocasia esculenta TaxID=4460 RepID=A0A843XNL5_COLES|nr:hypothetical protein [Colocasia esculenta]